MKIQNQDLIIKRVTFTSSSLKEIMIKHKQLNEDGYKIVEVNLTNDGCEGVLEKELSIADYIKQNPKLETEDPDFPMKEWRLAVSNEETRLGYDSWVTHQKEQHNIRK